MPQCAVVTCTNSHRKTKGDTVRYHRFPIDSTTRAHWIRACGKTVLNASTARICSRHFTARNYERDVQHELLGLPLRSRLKKGAVPHRYVVKDVDESVKDGFRKDDAIDVLLAVGLVPAATIFGGLPQDLSRMHVMEDVEEGCDGSGVLPSSPGHAEQRPDPVKASSEATPVAEEKKIASPEAVVDQKEEVIASTNGFPSETEENETKEEEVDTVKIVEDDKSSKESGDPVDDQRSDANSEKSDLVREEIEEETKTNVETRNSKQTENEEDSTTSSESSQEIANQTNKRKCDDEENASPAKKLRSQTQQQFPNHDRILSEYIEASGCDTVDELQTHTDQLLVEIRTLNELAKEKEREWNNIIHVKKVKEELLLRMQRKKQVLLLTSGLEKLETLDWDGEHEVTDRTKDNVIKQLMAGNSNSNPVVSSSSTVPISARSKDVNNKTRPRTILPKSAAVTDLNGQGECRQGRQGPILDVRSIIADYRQRHPEMVPRRGRRLKSVLNTTNNDGGKPGPANILSMTSLAFGAGSHVRHGSSSLDISNELGMLLSAMDSVRQDGSRSSSADSSITSGIGGSDPGVSFKDVLVQLARLSQNERQELQAQAANLAAAAAVANVHSANAKPPPPPYPEVTLHPVPVATTPVTVSATQNNSLLHGILTKTQPRADSKSTTFSPTLARLLTAPERASNNTQAMYTAALNSGVSISDLLSTGKSRNEITITPIGQYGHTKHKEGEHLDEDEAEDSADRLVIDEGNEITTADRNRTDNGSEAGDEVPQCQGCHQKSAQFVCAGCGNQWYCSRDCQVAAWDEHSEVCSG